MKKVRISNTYTASAAELWDIATDLDAVQDVMAGLIKFTGLPSGRVKTGQSITVKVSLFGLLPEQPYYMEVLECDDARMILRSNEKGAGVKTWRHKLQVRETATGSELIDEIEIDAGWLTWAFAAWARFLYQKRHEPRIRLLLDRANRGQQT